MYWHYDKRDPRPVLDVEVKLASVSGKHPAWRTSNDEAIKSIAEHCRVILKEDLDTYTRVEVRFEEAREASLVVFLTVIVAVTDKVLQFFVGDRMRLVEGNIQNQLSLHFGRSTTNVNVSITPEPNFALMLPGYMNQTQSIPAPPNVPTTMHSPPPAPAGPGGAVAVAPVVVTIPTAAPTPAPPARLPGHGQDPNEKNGGNGFFPALAIALLALVAAAVLFPRIGKLEREFDDLRQRFEDMEDYMFWQRGRDNRETYRDGELRGGGDSNSGGGGAYQRPAPPEGETYKPEKPEPKPTKPEEEVDPRELRARAD